MIIFEQFEIKPNKAFQRNQQFSENISNQYLEKKKCIDSKSKE